jgi:hypothetical protein
MNDPYRTAADMPNETKVKFPRLVFEQLGPKGRRLIQISENTFVVEQRNDHKDALGVTAVTWLQEAQLNEVSTVAFCLAKKLAEVLP